MELVDKIEGVKYIKNVGCLKVNIILVAEGRGGADVN